MDLPNMGVDEDDFMKLLLVLKASKRLEKLLKVELKLHTKILPIHQVR
jgi:hypothetical protein